MAYVLKELNSPWCHSEQFMGADSYLNLEGAAEQLKLMGVCFIGARSRQQGSTPWITCQLYSYKTEVTPVG